MDQITNQLDTYFKILDNKNVQLAVISLLALYSRGITRGMPEKMKAVLKYPLYFDIVTIVALVLIIYTSTKNITIAVLLTLCYLLTLITFNTCQSRSMIEEVRTEVNDVRAHVGDIRQHIYIPQQHQMVEQPMQQMQQMQMMPEQVYTELENDNVSNSEDSEDYRNKFYPQYADTENHQEVREEQDTISGFDKSNNFAQL
jgi:hypothetical protein